ncbi:DinB family protein [Tateyamaria sp.]|uniref:DinB family protein n=1 Tax=Tateyamaria sp. TaxID=1929288 RepID=UPI00329CD280
MIEAGYVRLMTRYNAWQNRQLKEMLGGMDDAALRVDRGAFFGSIMGTLNHILWADMLWMNRFDPRIPAPDQGSDHLSVTPTFAVWGAERFRLDGAFRMWADTLRSIDLKEQIAWYSVTAKSAMQASKEMCVIHLLNHQTHHRGQVHAMMTAAGLKAPVTDLVFLPEDA